MLVSYFLLLSSLSSSFCAPLCARGFVHVPRGTKASVPKFAFVVVMGTSSVDSTVRGAKRKRIKNESRRGCEARNVSKQTKRKSRKAMTKLVEHRS